MSWFYWLKPLSSGQFAVFPGNFLFPPISPSPHHLKFDTHGCADNPTLSSSLSEDDAERFLHKNQHS
ncbi:hypothetical protein [Coleofasciculus sp. E2-BRE-01]|uniref:hypothetical protein n=1 Tax=Coleofasciculus sp. E2-BRE-01 TaxID=3069524 RepID=UPI0032FED61E